ncbi:hypothetical protein [Nocardia gipuzkoensis]
MASQYAAVAHGIGHRFRADRSMADIIAEATTATASRPIEDWAA